MWWRWKNNRNVAVVHSFTNYEAVLKKNKCRVDMGSMQGQCGVNVGSMEGRCGRGWKNI